ncbi:hypothetical protein CROQUDRAFT_446458 [Cronartium quercuum f. sp. fusiforme G11]|uniref:Uncharacterized protein n=1 Tax=Cronartium quercuum f. sp. fusiforme G11 TaxID=708437 RepID=A0A9P6NPL1_9BASI|nr:hypothetical protein CROQUDRAFT_446458 [Cronartium quercuum f. sp. fusiforme G11]
MVKQASRECETAEGKTKKKKKVHLANLEESERETLEGLLLESQSDHQQEKKKKIRNLTTRSISLRN